MSSSFAQSPGAPQAMPPLGDDVLAHVRDHAIFTLDPVGRIASWNAAVRALFGYDEPEWIGQPLSLIYPSGDVERRLPERALDEAAAHGAACDERWLRRRDGGAMFGVATLTRIDGDDGRLVGFTKIVRDDTRARRAIEGQDGPTGEPVGGRRLREAATLDATIEAIPDGVYIGDTGGIARCNAAGLAFVGVTEARELQVPLDALSRRFRARRERDGALLETDDLPFARALRGEACTLRHWATKASGEDVWLQTHASPITVDGATIGAIAVSSDVTDLVKQEHRRRKLDRVQTILRARDQELRALVEGVREYAIFTVDTDGRISSWHEGARRMKGYTVHEAIGMPFADLFTEDERARGQPAHEMRVAAETGEYHGEGRRLRKNGEVFEASVVLTALRGARGDVLGYLKLTQDITARRRQERDRQQALHDAEAAQSAAESASRSMSEFLATISHELRTPLSAILGWAAVLSRTANGVGETKRGLDAITRNARIQIGLIEDLLDMNRIEAGQLRLDIHPVELPTVITSALEAVQPAARAKGLHLRTELDPILVTVLGDAARLQQVLWNLLMNAVKFTPRGGSVRVALKHVGDHVEMSVSDTGQGIAEEFLPHLFERFRQQDATTTRRHGGLGLGLAIVKQLTEMHGGSVSVTSAGPDLGSSFTVRVPAVTRDDANGTGDVLARSGEPAAGFVSGRARLDGTRILLVDDEADVRDIAAVVLREAGAHVTLAAHAREALALFVERPPDVLISDISMPEHDGYALLGWIRAMKPEEGGSVPVIAFTAFAMANDRRRVREAGFDGHLVKPVEPDAMVDAVHAALDGRDRVP